MAGIRKRLNRVPTNQWAAHRLKTFVQVGELGTIVEVHRGHSEPSGGAWVELPHQRCCDRILEDPAAYRIENVKRVGRGHRVGCTVPKPRCRLTRDDPNFLANGRDKALVMVVNWPEGISSLRMVVNSTVIDFPAEEDGRASVLEIQTETPGLWEVAITDPRVVCEPKKVLLRGWPDTQENRERLFPNGRDGVDG